MERQVKIKVNPLERKALLADLNREPNQIIYFVRTGLGEYDWKVLQVQNSLIEDMTERVAKLTQRQFGGSLSSLRGWKYDSPQMILDEIGKAIDNQVTYTAVVL